MSDIKKASFAYYNMLTENEFKRATLNVLKEAREDGSEDSATISIICFSAMEYGLKSELLSGAFRDLDSFRAIVDQLIDHLVTRDPDVLEAVSEHKKELAKSKGN